MTTESLIQKIWIEEITPLRVKKQADYGESWKKMRAIGITDIIDVKIHRIKQFEEKGILNHESMEDSLKDIINYCFFRILKEREK
jgi:hypothetical protein